jgi:hypothetical protein
MSVVWIGIMGTRLVRVYTVIYLMHCCSCSSHTWCRIRQLHTSHCRPYIMRPDEIIKSRIPYYMRFLNQNIKPKFRGTNILISEKLQLKFLTCFLPWRRLALVVRAQEPIHQPNKTHQTHQKIYDSKSFHYFLICVFPFPFFCNIIESLWVFGNAVL